MADIKEKEAEKGFGGGSPVSKTDSNEIHQTYGNAHERPDFLTRLGVTPGSFKRRTGADANNQLNQTLKKRHLHMIAIGGSIGAGLFVGSGSALRRGGPATLLIDFGIIGIMIFNVVWALGELAVMYPVSGGFYTYSTRFIDPSWGFAMGWNYVFQWAIVVPLELTVASLTVEFWELDLNIAVFISVFWVALMIISLFGVLGYGEEEFWSSLLKLSTIVIFLITGLVLVCGGGPSDGKYNEYWGARYWYDPGAFQNGFKGFCSVFVTAAFAFSGTELVGLAAAESANPVKNLPGAVKQVFWRITLFFLLALLFVGLLVRSDDERLLGSSSDASTSPFVIAARDAGLRGFDSFINVVILISVVSIGLSGVYGGSRTLTALAEQGYAPGIFKYVDRAGRPLPSTALVLACGALAYIQLNSTGVEVFNWLVALSGLAALFTWGSICLAHIRFRQAWRYNGHTIEELPFRSAFGEIGSWVGLGLIVLILIAQFYTALYPPGAEGGPNAYDFFLSMLAVPVVIFFWIVGYLWKGKAFLRVDQIDVHSGMREHDWDEIRRINLMRDSQPWYMRAMHIFF